MASLCSLTVSRRRLIGIFKHLFSTASPTCLLPPESIVLTDLASLLPTSSEPKPPGEFHKPAVNLSPADRLRGIFLQTFPGRATLFSALSSAASTAALTSELFAEVLDRGGGLSGSATISFFDWATESGHPEALVTVEVCNAALRALGRKKFFSFFDEIFSRMKRHRIEPNMRTLEIVFDSLVAGRRVVKAVNLYRRLEEIGWEKDLLSFNLLLKCLCKRSHVSVANSMFVAMRGELVYDNETYSEIIGGWARLGRVDKVKRHWAMMQADGLTPNADVFSHLIEALGRAGRTEDAVKVFEKMESEGCTRNALVYNAMITNFISIGDFEKCITYYKDMCENNCLPDIDTYRKLIRAFIRVRRVADALKMFDEMLSRGLHPSTTMVTSFVQPLCCFGPPHAAMLFYKKSKKAGCIVSLKTYKLLLARLSRFGKSGTVLKVWEEMQESGFSTDKDVYESIVNGLCNIGKIETAIRVVEESLEKGFCLGKVVYSKLNNKLLEANKVETAYKLFLKVRDARTRANALSYARSNGWHFG